MTPWGEYVAILLPGLASMLASVVPLALGTFMAVFRLRKREAGPYVRNLWGSTVAGLVVLVLLFGSLFGKDLSSSSTAGLIFLFAPIYSAIALAVGYGMGAVVYRKSVKRVAAEATPGLISINSRRFVWVPVAMLGVLLFGIVKYSVQYNDLAVAEQASNPETLQWVYERAAKGEADPFGVPLFLAQNPNTPGDILDQLSRHEHASVRTFVVRHPNTSLSVVARMSNDCDALVRKEVQERLQPQSGSSNNVQPAPNCATTVRNQ